MFGGPMNQVGWGVLAFTMIFFWGFFMNCEALSWFSFSGNLQTTHGAVTRSERTNASEGGGKGRRGTPIYANHFAFTVNRKEYTGCSYATGTQLSLGQNVSIEYSPSNPATSRIQGMRSRIFGPAAVFVLLFPLIGLAFLVPGYFFGRKARRLLERGQLSEAVLREKLATNTRINKQTVFKLSFEFLSAPGRTHQVTTKTHETSKLEDEATEQILFDPENPDQAVLVDLIGDRFCVDEMGNIQPASSRSALLATFIPFLTITGNLAYAIYRQY